MSNNYESSIGILAVISVFLTTVMIFLGCYLKQLRKHPGGLVITEYFSVLLYNSHFCLIPAIGVYVIFRHIPDETCKYFSIVFILSYFLTWNYNTCLSIEVFIKLKKITNQSYSSRRKLYHLGSWIFAIVLTTLIGIENSYGRTSYNCCFVKRDSFGHYFELIPVGFNFPLILIFSILSIKTSSKAFEPLMVGLTISNLLLALTLTISNLLTFFDKFKWVNELEMNVGAAIGACSGIVVSGSRLLSKSLYVKVRKTWKESAKKFHLDEFRRESQYDESSEINFNKSNIWNLSMFFDNLTKKTVSEILITLYIRFKYDKFEGFNSKLLINYPKEKYERISLLIPYIKNLYKDDNFIVEYCPNTFELIRARIGLRPEILSESLINSDNFTNIKVEGTNKGGKSGSFFLKTSDGQLILKTIKRTERKTFINKMLIPYTEQISNKHSKLVRILGVFKALPSDLDFIIMENIMPYDIEMSVFDIKGYSSKNRTGSNTMKKDTEFIEEFEPIQSSIKTELIKTIRDDLFFLKGLGIMDYSVLIVDLHLPYIVHSRYLVRDVPRPLLIGVIDFFQEFNFRKTAEYKLKKFFSSQEISCVDPGKYYTRLLDFLMKYL